MTLEIVCHDCGHTLEETALTQYGPETALRVRPCQNCLLAARDDRIESLEEELQDLQHRLDDLQP